VVARAVDATAFPNAPLLGFENHLNLFHENKRGLPRSLAYGLAVYLNSTSVDESFRRFNGHTQVNATDLKCSYGIGHMGIKARRTLSGNNRS